MNTLEITIPENRIHFSPGEVMSGEVAWDMTKPPASIELRLLWFTLGTGTDDAKVVETQRFDTPAAVERRAFEFHLPESPYSFTGNLISLAWALELVAKKPNENSRAEFVIAPGGKVIVLHPDDQPEPDDQ